MKKILALLLALVMLIGVLAGCTNQTQPNDDPDATGDPSTTDSGNQPSGSPDVAYVNAYKSTFSESITSMNPYCTGGTSDYIFIANLVDGLVETDKYGATVPALAESWEHNEDYSVWTFHLRPDVYWVDHNGEETEYKVTADDFVAGIRYIGEPKHTASSFSSISGIIAGLEEYYNNLVAIDGGEDIGMTREEALASFDETVGVKALDEYTVEYTLSGPCSYFLSYANLDLTLPVEQAFLDEVGDDYGLALDKMLYCGGYYISTWELDKRFVMTKNEHTGMWTASRWIRLNGSSFPTAFLPWKCSSAEM